MDKLLSESRHFFYLELSAGTDILKTNRLFKDELLTNKKESNLFAIVKKPDHTVVKNILNDCVLTPGKNFLLEMVFETAANKQVMVVWEMCGKFHGDLVIIHAIGQQKEYDNEIWDYIENHKLTQQHYQSLFDQNSDVVCSLDPLGNFISGNKSSETTTGYTINELKGNNIHLLFHPKDRAVTTAAFENAVKGTMQNYEARLVTKQGKIRFCNVTNLPIILNNLVFGVYVIAKDVTDRVLAERKIKRDGDLMKKVQGELHLLVEELTQVNNDLRQFTYITSHNLRSPLANMMSILDLVDRNSMGSGNLDLFQMFQQTTRQLFDAVVDLMEILVMKHKGSAASEPILVDQVFEEVKASISKKVEEAGGTIITSFPVNTVSFNRTYLESILLNLLTNAIKYRSPNRPLTINVSTSEEPGYVVLSFTDNGVGLDMKRYKDRIFGLYQRFHDNADSKGLGLYIVKSQVTAFGGKIEADSEVDKGTTFTIYFKK
jgi:PAS domain S-box-containing protein